MVLHKILVTGFIFLLGGCSWIYGDNGLIHSSEYDYLKATEEKPLELPPGFQDARLQELYPVPEVDSSGPVGRALEVEAPSLVLTLGDGVRIDRTGALPQVWIQDEIPQVWAILQSYLRDNQIGTRINDAQGHTVITDWLEGDRKGFLKRLFGGNDALERARFRVELNAADDGRETRVQVAQTGKQVREEEGGEWQDQAASDRQATRFMNRFIAYYDIRRNEIASERVARAGGINLRLGRDRNNNPALLADQEFFTVWNRVPRAFEKVGLRAVDRDQGQGMYYFNHEDPEDGFWASLFGKERALPDLPYGNYQLRLVAQDGETTLTMMDVDGTPLDEQLLTKIYPPLAEQFKTRRLDD